jgi:hypothetical protein
MIQHFVKQDLVHLENKNWGGWNIDQLCPKCNKGHLQWPGEKEDTGIKTTEFFRCDYCGSEFRNYRRDT